MRLLLIIFCLLLFGCGLSDTPPNNYYKISDDCEVAISKEGIYYKGNCDIGNITVSRIEYISLEPKKMPQNIKVKKTAICKIIDVKKVGSVIYFNSKAKGYKWYKWRGDHDNQELVDTCPIKFESDNSYMVSSLITSDNNSSFYITIDNQGNYSYQYQLF